MGDGCNAEECEKDCKNVSVAIRKWLFAHYYDLNEHQKVRIDYKNFKYHNG